MGGVWWIIERRIRLQKMKNNAIDELNDDENEK